MIERIYIFLFLALIWACLLVALISTIRENHPQIKDVLFRCAAIVVVAGITIYLIGKW